MYCKVLKYSGAENVACTIIKMFNQASDNIIFFYTSPNGKIKDVLNKKISSIYRWKS